MTREIRVFFVLIIVAIIMNVLQKETQFCGRSVGDSSVHFVT